jgi:V/A-type H+-transporting ATPase subunit K
MDAEIMTGLGKVGAACALVFGALGSTLGIGAAGPAAVGAWKKCYLQNKAAPFILVTFIGAPLSQTIYGMILMITMIGKADDGYDPWALLGIGIAAGLGMGISAYGQGKVGAYCADALAETGQGFSNYLAVIGIVETVAIFVLVFSLLALG